jgi:DNA-binding MarR family transcriptional regulator
MTTAAPNDFHQESKVHLTRLFHTLNEFSDVTNAMPVSYIQFFLMVARDPGKGATEYGRKLGVQQAVASRILLEIGQKSRGLSGGFGLVESSVDPIDLRLKRYHLTLKGRELAERVITRMKGK